MHCKKCCLTILALWQSHTKSACHRLVMVTARFYSNDQYWWYKHFKTPTLTSEQWVHTEWQHEQNILFFMFFPTIPLQTSSILLNSTKPWKHIFISKQLQNYYCAFLMASWKLKWPLKVNSHMPCHAHVIPMLCHINSHMPCHATPLPFFDSAVSSFVKVHMVARKIRTASSTV
jgi:hypothetical protein